MNSNVLQKFCNAYTESINKLQFESLITSVWWSIIKPYPAEASFWAPQNTVSFYTLHWNT